MKKKRFALCAILLVLVLLCCGCSKALSRFEENDLRKNTEMMIDAIIADDLQTAYAPFSEVCTEDSFAGVFSEMRNIVGSADTYKLKLLSVKTNVHMDDGLKISTIDGIYKLTAGERIIIIDVGMDSQKGLNSFSLTPYQYTDYYSVGTLSNMKGATWSQVILLLSNIIPLGLTVFAFVDCIRKKMKNKVLWFLLLIFGFATLGATVSASGLTLNFNLSGIAAYSALIRYGSGATTTRIMVPVGAFIYFIVRLSRISAAPVPPEEENTDSVQQAAEDSE